MLQQIPILNKDKADYYLILDQITGGTNRLPAGTSLNKSAIVLSQVVETLKDTTFIVGSSESSNPSTANFMTNQLNKSDAFIATDFLACIAQTNSTTDFLNVRNMLYPNQRVLGTNALNFYSLYNGSFNIMVGSAEVQKGIQMMENIVIPTSQEGLTMHATPLTTGTIDADGYFKFTDAKQPFSPYMIFNGGVDNRINYKAPTTVGATAVDLTTTAKKNFFRIFLFGYLLVGGGSNSNNFNL
jgi:hypothetical protein